MVEVTPINRNVYDSFYCPDPSLPANPTISTSSASTYASIDFFNRARKALVRFRSIEFFGELAETLAMIRNPARALRKTIPELYKTLKKRSKGIRGSAISMARRKHSIWGDTWLEWAFGWAPLINDVADATLALDKLMFLPKPFWFVKGVGFDSSGGVPTRVSFKVNVSGQEGSYSEVSIQKAIVKFYGNITTTDNFAGSPRVLGLRASDIPNAIWELTPWSFLIDYFTNVGDVINACSFPHADVSWVSKTTLTSRRIERVLTSSLVENQDNPLNRIISVSSTPGYMKSEQSFLTRFRVSSYPSVNFQWRIPGFSTKWLNIAALVSMSKDFA
jgi:hypothetical protein